MREILIATRNDSKVEDFRVGLKDLPFTLITLNDTDVPRDYVVDEPGTTYEAHAAIKAILYGKKANRLTLADDSGLEVDALNGWPGFDSGTWLKGNHADRINGVLEKIKNVPDEKRGAQFRAVLALFDPTADKVNFAEGICRGRLLREPKGESGFGYDPIFFSDDLGKTFGEASIEEKARVSHRGRALEKVRKLLETM